ncbi:helicase [Streptomyces virginiae]
MTVKLGVWITNTKQRCRKLTQGQLNTLAELAVPWA